MRTLSTLILIAWFGFCSYAQVSEVTIAVNGLTCSQCTRSVELSIRKLDFVREVEMNLEHTQGVITFQEGLPVQYEKIAKAVVDAGFSVRELTVKLEFSQVEISSGYCYEIQGSFFQFVKTSTQTLDGTQSLTLLGKDFLPKKEAKKWKHQLKELCSSVDSTSYFVTL